MPINRSNLPSRLPLDRAGRIDMDLTCMGCGYNLRGLSPTSVCSECGLDIAESISTRRLLFADADWLRRVERSFRHTTIAVALLPIVTAGMLMAWAALRRFGVMEFPPPALLVWVVHTFAITLLWRRATLPAPSEAASIHALASRHAGHVTWLAFVLSLILAVYEQEDAANITRAIVWVGLLLTIATGYLYLAELVRRIPYRVLTWSTRLVAGLGLLLAVSVIACSATRLAMTRFHNWLETWFVSTLIATLVYYILAQVMATRHWRRIAAVNDAIGELEDRADSA